MRRDGQSESSSWIWLVFGVTLWAIFSGCWSSVAMRDSAIEETDEGTLITSVTMKDGRTIDFTSESPGYAVVQDSLVNWSAENQSHQEFRLSQVQSMSVLRFSWWKTAVFVVVVPTIFVVIGLLTIKWRFG
jgi:hypothetical protein